MIPNIFISSTISDLHYLRDALRDAVSELAYNSVMSDYGEVGYLHRGTASDSCYRSLSQCQMVVLIIGKKYGNVTSDGYSVTHREFLAARKNEIPIITFVDKEVLSYKNVYDANPDADIWDSFREMDSSKKTFAFIEEVKASNDYNGLIPFTTAGEAKRVLKLQIADFVGERLNGVIQPVRTEVQEVLAEIRTLRNQLVQTSGESDGNQINSRKYLTIMRFLLDDKYAGYRKLIETLAGDLDAAIPVLIEAKDFESVLSKFHFELEIVESVESIQSTVQKHINQSSGELLGASYSLDGGYAIFRNKILLSPNILKRFKRNQEVFQMRLLAV